MLLRNLPRLLFLLLKKILVVIVIIEIMNKKNIRNRHQEVEKKRLLINLAGQKGSVLIKVKMVKSLPSA